MMAKGTEMTTQNRTSGRPSHPPKKKLGRITFLQNTLYIMRCRSTMAPKTSCEHASSMAEGTWTQSTELLHQAPSGEPARVMVANVRDAA